LRFCQAKAIVCPVGSAQNYGTHARGISKASGLDIYKLLNDGVKKLGHFNNGDIVSTIGGSLSCDHIFFLKIADSWASGKQVVYILVA